jgi:hypothetical protein
MHSEFGTMNEEVADLLTVLCLMLVVDVQEQSVCVVTLLELIISVKIN